MAKRIATYLIRVNLEDEAETEGELHELAVPTIAAVDEAVGKAFAELTGLSPSEVGVSAERVDA